MIIRDQEEILFFINPTANPSEKIQDEMCLWTNCKSLVQAFMVVFEDYWHNSVDIEEKIVEIESGKITTKTQIIEDCETAREKFNNAIQATEREITTVTSAEGLIEIWKNEPLVKLWIQKGILLKSWRQ